MTTASDGYDVYARWIDACARAFNDHLAQPSAIRMSQATWLLFVRQRPPYAYTPLATALPTISHPGSLANPFGVGIVHITEDNGLPYGELEVTFRVSRGLTDTPAGYYTRAVQIATDPEPPLGEPPAEPRSDEPLSADDLSAIDEWLENLEPGCDGFYIEVRLVRALRDEVTRLREAQERGA